MDAWMPVLVPVAPLAQADAESTVVTPISNFRILLRAICVSVINVDLKMSNLIVFL